MYRDMEWDRLKKKAGKKDAVLNHVFAKGNEDLCERLTAALTANEVDTRNYGGVAAVKCGYEFVWYELGYTYFYAAHSSTDYKWELKGGAYDAKCGQIFFFP
ncbi:hypothetical protein AAVH_11196 [Aphelenchoides avenae]|nr:hypothetical protein AAVH_11196 [Aphelenchus avenae]